MQQCEAPRAGAPVHCTGCTGDSYGTAITIVTTKRSVIRPGTISLTSVVYWPH